MLCWNDTAVPFFCVNSLINVLLCNVNEYETIIERCKWRKVNTRALCKPV